MSDTYPFRFPHTQYGVTFQNRGQWVGFLKKEAEDRAQQLGIPKGVMSGLIEQESSWNGYKSGKNKNGTLDAGLTQINQTNWSRFNVRSAEELGTDPLRSIDIGATLLDESIKANKGNMFLALSAYQRGQGNLNRTLRGEAEVPAVAKDYPVKVLFRAAKYGAPLPSEGELTSMTKRLGYDLDLEKARKSAGVTGSMLSTASRVDDRLILPTDKQEREASELVEMLQAQSVATPLPDQSLLVTTEDESLELSPPTAAPVAQNAVPTLDESLLGVEQELTDLGSANDRRRRLAEAFGAVVDDSKDSGDKFSFIDSVVDSELESA